GIAEHRERRHRSAEHSDLETEILRDADRNGVIDRARTYACRSRQDRTQGIAAFSKCHRKFLRISSLRGAKRRSNPPTGPLTLDCFASLAMTVLIALISWCVFSHATKRTPES